MPAMTSLTACNLATSVNEYTGLLKRSLRQIVRSRVGLKTQRAVKERMLIQDCQQNNGSEMPGFQCLVKM